MANELIAEAIIAAKDEEIAELNAEIGRWGRDHGKLSDKAQDLQADNAALTARVKDLELSSKHSADVASNAIADMKALETQLAAVRGIIKKVHDLLMNMQPHIPQAIESGNPAFIDNYVDIAIEKTRAALEAKP